MSALAVPASHMLTLSPDLRRRLTALTHIASTSDAKPLLTGVCFDADGAWATNSYAAGFVPTNLALEGKHVVPAKLLRLALKQARKADVVDIAFGSDEAEVSLTHKGRRWLSMLLPYIEGAYPNVRASAGNVDPTMSDRKALNDRLRRLESHDRPFALAVPFLDAVAALAGESARPHPVVIQHQTEPLKPVHVYDMDGRWLGLVMPQRHSDMEVNR